MLYHFEKEKKWPEAGVTKLDGGSPAITYILPVRWRRSGLSALPGFSPGTRASRGPVYPAEPAPTSTSAQKAVEGVIVLEDGDVCGAGRVERPAAGGAGGGG